MGEKNAYVEQNWSSNERRIAAVVFWEREEVDFSTQVEGIALACSSTVTEEKP